MRYLPLRVVRRLTAPLVCFVAVSAAVCGQEPAKKGGFTTSPDGSGFTAGSLDLGDWQVQPDPPPAQAASAPAKIKIPFPPKTKSTDVLFAAGSGMYVALGNNLKATDTREIYDLATGEKAGKIRGLVVPADRAAALSSDASYFAASLGFSEKPALGVWDIKGQKPLGQLEADTTKGTVDHIKFAGSDRLIAATFNGPIRAWEIPSGTIVLDVPAHFKTKKTMAVSPGGRYLAFVVDDLTIRAYDLTTGKPAGELTLPKSAAEFTIEASLAFSPDGSELAGIFHRSDRATLLSIKLDGTVTAQHTFEKELSSVKGQVKYPGPTLEWLPDASGWLVYGHAIVDRTAGGPVWVAPIKDPGSSSPRRFLNKDTIIGVTGTAERAQLVSGTLPWDKIRSGTELISSGGRAEDVDLPPLKATDFAEAPVIDLKVQAGWTYRPGAAAAPPANLVRSVRLADVPPLVEGIALSGPAAARAAVWVSNKPEGAANNLFASRSKVKIDELSPLTIYLYDLVEGARAGELKIDYPGELADLSPNGKVALVRTKKPADRLDLWIIQTGKHHAGWRPYGDLEESARTISKVGFLGDRFVYTINSRHKLIVWDAATLKALYQADNVFHARPTPGGQHLAIVTSSEIDLLSADTGDVAGKIFFTGGLVGDIAFTPDGTRMAAIRSSFNNLYYCAAYDLEKGESIADFQIPKQPKSIEWCNSGFLLCNHQWLIDLAQQRIVWEYRLAELSEIQSLIPKVDEQMSYLYTSPRHAAQPLGGRHWYLQNSPSQPINLLVGLELPEPETLAVLKKATIPEDSLLRPGATVALKLELKHLPADQANFPQELLNKLTAVIEKQGMKVAAGAPLTLVAGTSLESLNINHEFHKLGPGADQGKITVPATVLHCRLAFEMGGKTLWEDRVVFSNAQYFISNVQKDLAAQLAAGQWKGAAERLLSADLPKHVYPGGSIKVAGVSTLGPGKSMASAGK